MNYVWPACITLLFKKRKQSCGNDKWKNSILYLKQISVYFVWKTVCILYMYTLKKEYKIMWKILKKQLIKNHDIDNSNTVEIFCRLKKSCGYMYSLQIHVYKKISWIWNKMDDILPFKCTKDSNLLWL